MDTISLQREIATIQTMAFFNPLQKLKDVRFRSCPNCGSFNLTKGLLCGQCMELALQSWLQSREQLIRNHSVISLFLWPPGKSDTLSWLIRELKTAPLSTWSYYAKLFCIHQQLQVTAKTCLLISHKSHSGHKHAFFWGQGLSQALGVPHIEALTLTGSPQKQQKDLRAQDRAKRSMGKLVDFSYESGMKIVFVDDVVTTGGTAEAAYKALGSPKNFQVWALATRPFSSIATSQRA